jgi:hypothetical protein
VPAQARITTLPRQEIDHRTDWANTKRTILEELASQEYDL